MKRKTLNIAIVFALLFSLFACEHFEELNSDPKKSTENDPDKNLTYVQLRLTGNREDQWRYNLAYSSGIIQHYTNGWAIGKAGKYNIDKGYFQSFWLDTYPMITNLEEIINATADNPALANKNAIARVMRAYIFSRLTDTYGDLPYFEGGKAYSEGVLYPKYDGQEEIYNHLFVELKACHDQLSTSAEQAYGDLFYDGDINQWKKLINSLRLRLAIRIYHANPTKSEAEARAALEGELIRTVADICKIEHMDVPYSEKTDYRGNGSSQAIRGSNPRMCAPFVDIMQDNNDPRLTMILGVFGNYQTDADNGKVGNAWDSKSVDITQEFLDQFGSFWAYPPGYYTWDSDIPGLDDAAGEAFFGTSGWGVLSVTDSEGETVVFNRYCRAMQIRPEISALDAPYMHFTAAESELRMAEAALRWNIAPESAQAHFEKAIDAHIAAYVELYGCPAPDQAAVDAFKASYTLTGKETEEQLKMINEQIYITTLLNGPEAFANWRASGYPQLEAVVDESLTDNRIKGSIPRRLEYPQNELDNNLENMLQVLPDGIDFWGNKVWWDQNPNDGIIGN